MSAVYQPGEDSRLLLKNAEPRMRGAVLDIGTGSGLLAVEAAQNPDVTRVVAVDINSEAVKATMKRADDGGVVVDVRHGDLFEPVKGELFDLILFNSPYLPSEGEADEPSWAGGQRGDEVITRFLDEAYHHLNPGGIVLMIYSTHSNLELEKWDTIYCIEVLEELAIFYERLFCVLLRPR